MIKKKYAYLILLILASLFINLYGANWDNLHYLHPDERLYINASNISLPTNLKEFLSPNSRLNPHMFYYGPFPLYLYKIFNLIINPTINLLFTSRLLSGIITTLTTVLIYFIGKKVFDEKIGLFSSIAFTFAPGIIQHAHFITTESTLNFLISLIILLCILLVKSKKYYLFLIIGIILGCAEASKIIGVTFALIPLIAYFLLIKFNKDYLKTTMFFIGSMIIFVLISIILSPYQIIDFKNFINEQKYMQGVILGSNIAPFTIIYKHTLSYLYPVFRVFPLIFGFITLPISLIGLFILLYIILTSFIKKVPKNTRYDYKILLIILLYPIVYYAWVGSWFAKFSRYYILLIPFLSITFGYMFNLLKKKLQLVILFLIIFNGLIFFVNIYFKTNTRLEASSWIYNNISAEKIIAGEHWDDNLPLPMNIDKRFKNIQLPIYDEPDSYNKTNDLVNLLYKSDYFIISSRRVYYSILQNKDIYPLTANLYQLLFKEKLGFKLVKSFTNYPFIFSDDWADESFQSYDHPPVLIFVNQKKLNPDKMISLIYNEKN